LHFGDKQIDRQTYEQMDSIDALSRSRYRERRLNNIYTMYSDYTMRSKLEVTPKCKLL